MRVSQYFQTARRYVNPRSPSLRQRTVWSTQGKQEYSNPAIWVWYGPCCQKSALYFQRSGTRISWSRGVLGEWKTLLKSSSQRGAFQSFFCFCFDCSSPLYCRLTVKITFVSPGGYIFQRWNITTGNDRSQNLPGSKCFRFKKNQNGRDIVKKTSVGRHWISFRHGDHRVGFQMNGLETIALVFAQPPFFLFFQYWPNLEIKTMLCPKLHILGLMSPDFGGHF